MGAMYFDDVWQNDSWVLGNYFEGDESGMVTMSSNLPLTFKYLPDQVGETNVKKTTEPDWFPDFTLM